jgi:hypothetical protein
MNRWPAAGEYRGRFAQTEKTVRKKNRLYSQGLRASDYPQFIPPFPRGFLMLQEVSNAIAMNKYIKAHRIEGGFEKSLAGHHVYANIAHNKLVDLSLRHTKTDKVLATVTSAQVSTFFNFVEESYKSSNYRDVKNNAQWRAVYNVQDDTPHPYVHRTHGLMIKTEPTVSCRACGIVLPLKVTTVDHQAPQTGGDIGAICRIFRGLGLTLGAPRGKKNKTAVQANAVAVGGTVPQLEGSWDERYSFNDAGTIYYSIAKEADQLGKLAGHCMQHMLNLRPVCGPCNSRLKNSGAF